jgi:BolA protein
MSAGAAVLRQRLEQRFAPLELSVEDEGHLHIGHANAGRGHFRVRIVAEAFRGLTPVARHRMVYAALEDLMQSDVHAIAIEASPPS